MGQPPPPQQPGWHPQQPAWGQQPGWGQQPQWGQPPGWGQQPPPQHPHGQYPYGQGQQGWSAYPGYAQPRPKRRGKGAGVVIAVVIVLVVLCGGAGAVAYFTGVFGSSDPTEVVEAYFEAAQRGDCAEMIDLVTEESWRQTGATSRGEAISNCEADLAALGGAGLPIQLTSTRLVSEGDTTAVVAATIGATPGFEDFGAPPVPMDVDIPLRKEGGDWRIDATAMGGGLNPGSPSVPGLDDPLAPPPTDIEIPDIEIPEFD